MQLRDFYLKLAYGVYFLFPHLTEFINEKRFVRSFDTLVKGIPSSPKVGLFTTMPKSGTWYTRYFFYFYDQLLKGNSDPLAGVRSNMGNFMKNPVRTNDTLGLDLLYVCHSTCPGFQNHKNELGLDWDELDFYAKGFDYVDPLFKAFPEVFDPEINSNLKVVYLYRNPLDQAVSFFRYITKHRDKNYRFRKDSSGRAVEITSVADYILTVGLDAYIKQFITFKFMSENHPGFLKMYQYEELISRPEHVFRESLEFLEHTVHEGHFQTALKLASRDSIKKLERSMVGGIGNYQTDKKEKHIRDGSAGQWENYLRDDEIQLIEKKLAAYGLSLSEFTVVLKR